MFGLRAHRMPRRRRGVRLRGVRHMGRLHLRGLPGADRNGTCTGRRVIMGRQERAARRARMAAQRGDQVVEEATERVRAATGTANGGTSASVDLAAECRRLRDEGGMAWWLIGKTLGLPGAGDSATTGKAGAHQARKLYASTGAEVPRTRAPRNGGQPAKGPALRGSKVERKIMVTMGTHVIPNDYTDEEIIAYVHGRTIEWGINIKRLCNGKGEDHWTNQEARVHPTDVIIDEYPDEEGGRVLRFREFLGYERDERSSKFGQPIGGSTRTVRVSAIHTVR